MFDLFRKGYIWLNWVKYRFHFKNHWKDTQDFHQLIILFTNRGDKSRDDKNRSEKELKGGSLQGPVFGIHKYIYIYLDLSDFVKTWPPGFRLVPGAARIQASPVSKKIGGLTSWSAPAGQPRYCPNSRWVDQALGSKLVWGREGAVLTQPLQ